MKYEELKDEIKAAMKAHDNVRRDILRQVHGEIKNIEVNERREVTDADVDAMLKRVIKQTSETLEGSIKAANNDERTAMLKEQVEILEGYLPKQLAGEMGKVMGALTAATGGNFDKAQAAKEVGSRLS